MILHQTGKICGLVESNYTLTADVFSKQQMFQFGKKNYIRIDSITKYDMCSVLTEQIHFTMSWSLSLMKNIRPILGLSHFSTKHSLARPTVSPLSFWPLGRFYSNRNPEH